LYVRACTDGHFSWRKSDWWHLLLPMLFYAYSLFLWSRPFEVKQWFWQNMGWVQISWEMLVKASAILYFVWAWRRYFRYRRLVQSEFSNAEQRMIEWLYFFLWVGTAYFIFSAAYELAGNIFDFFYTEWYYLELVRGGLLYFISLRGWNFAANTDMDFEHLEQRETAVSEEKNYLNLSETAPKLVNKPIFAPEEAAAKGIELETYMAQHKPWLDPELTLSELAAKLNLSHVQLSALVNNTMGKNFNDFVNAYRVEAVKQRLAEGAGKQFSLLGIAYECGFNSKATFNRAFKKATGKTPGAFS
jgi:AraC-like DNA-binding protein